MRPPILALLLVVAPGVASCGPEPPASDPGGPGDAAEAPGLDALYDRFSAAYADLDALVGLYADDALYLPPEGDIRQGRSAVRESFSPFFEWAAEQGVSVELSFHVVDRTAREDLVVDVGYYSLKTNPPADSGQEPGRSVGKFVTVAERSDDGEWRFRIDGYNLAPLDAFEPPPAPVRAQGAPPAP